MGTNMNTTNGQAATTNTIILDELPFKQRLRQIAQLSPEERIAYEEAQRMHAEQLRLKTEQREHEARQLRHQLFATNLAMDLGPRYSIDRATLDSFVLHAPTAQQPILNRLRTLAAELPAMTKEGRGIIWLGSIGTGKDHLAAALLYVATLQHGFRCRWVNGRHMAQLSRDAMDRAVTEASVLNELMGPDILCLSDPVLPHSKLTDWNIDLLYRIVDDRCRHLRPTWLTLNARNVAEADERLTPAVFDRLRDQAELVTCLWPSWRKERR